MDTRNDWQLLPLSRESSAKRIRGIYTEPRKNCHVWANRPQAPSTHVLGVSVYQHWRRFTYVGGARPRVPARTNCGNLWMILCLAVASHPARSHRIIVASWKPDPSWPNSLEIRDWVTRAEAVSSGRPQRVARESPLDPPRSLPIPRWSKCWIKLWICLQEDCNS